MPVSKQRKKKPRVVRQGSWARDEDDYVPAAVTVATDRIRRAWDGAVAAGLMAAGAETKYHMLADGQVLSVAIGTDGQMLANGQELTPAFADELRRVLPGLAVMVTFYEDSHRRGVGLSESPPDGATWIARG